MPYPQTTIATTDRYLKVNRETVLRFLRAYSEGMHRFVNDREFSMRVIGKYTKISVRPTLTATYDDYAPYVKKIPKPTPESVKTVLEQLTASDPKARTAQPQEFIDRGIVEELEQKGLFQQTGVEPYGGVPPAD